MRSLGGIWTQAGLRPWAIPFLFRGLCGSRRDVAARLSHCQPRLILSGLTYSNGNYQGEVPVRLTMTAEKALLQISEKK